MTPLPGVLREGTEVGFESVTIGTCVLHLGDCREVLPSLGVIDALVTDPPYGLGKRWVGGGGSAKSSWGFHPSEAKLWDGEVLSGVEEMVAQARQAIVWGGNYYSLPPSRCWLIWDKKTPDSFTTGQAEMAWTNLDIPTRVFRFAQCEQANEGTKFHPTQKPLSLMEWCLKWIECEAVVDCCMGSGTTGVACINLGRKFIGIEIDPTYFAIAVKRIERAWQAKRSEIKWDEPAPMKQRELIEV